MKHASVAALAFGLVLSTSAFASADKAISSAEAARQAASQVGYEWRDTAKMIEKAKELAKAGKTEEAVALAKKAERQGLNALAQYRSEQQRFGK